MYRVKPKASKLLNKKWTEHDLEIHQQKLKEIKPTYNIKEPH